MHLSPDEIQRRTFAIEDRGYDRDQVRDFLLEVASALRMALHTTRPPTAADPSPRTPDTSGSAEAAGSDPFAQLGSEVAEVLRSAHEAVALLRAQADHDVEAQLLDAGSRADDIRRQAEADAAWSQDRARRVLITAQEQADGIIAEAERAAADLLELARQQAEDQSDQVATRTRRHAEQILRAEREALRRLHQAQAGVAAAVEMLTGSETRPVVDLTELRPSVRLGEIDVEAAAGDRGVLPDPSLEDPLVRMVRSAVDRAAEHARRTDAFADPADLADPSDPAADDGGAGTGSGDDAAGGDRERSRPIDRRLDGVDDDPAVAAARRAAASTAGRARSTGAGAQPDPDGGVGDVAPVAPVRRPKAPPTASAPPTVVASAEHDPIPRASH